MRFNRREPTPPERHLVGSGRVKERRGPPTGRPMGQMIGVLAEPERSRTIERIQAGMNEARRRGGEVWQEEEAIPGADRQGPQADRGWRTR